MTASKYTPSAIAWPNASVAKPAFMVVAALRSPRPRHVHDLAHAPPKRVILRFPRRRGLCAVHCAAVRTARCPSCDVLGRTMDGRVMLHGHGVRLRIVGGPARLERPVIVLAPHAYRAWRPPVDWHPPADGGVTPLTRTRSSAFRLTTRRLASCCAASSGTGSDKNCDFDVRRARARRWLRAATS